MPISPSPSHPSLSSFYPEARHDIRDGRPQQRSRSSSTPPHIHHLQQRTGFLPDASLTWIMRRRLNSDVYFPALTPGRVLISSSVGSPLIPGVSTNAPHVLTRRRKDSYRRPKILFYHKYEPHYGFTNFSAYPVMYEGRKYPTSEHLFQSFKVSKSRH